MLIVAEEVVLTEILKPIPPPWFFGKISKHFDVHFNSSPEFKAYIYKLSKPIVMSFKNLRWIVKMHSHTDSDTVTYRQTDGHKEEKKSVKPTLL